MKLTRKEARNIVQADHQDWVLVPDTMALTGQHRWTIDYVAVFQHVPSGRYYSLRWTEGATEMQDQDPFDYEDPNPVEVQQVERTVKVWEPVDV